MLSWYYVFPLQRTGIYLALKKILGDQSIRYTISYCSILSLAVAVLPLAYPNSGAYEKLYSIEITTALCLLLKIEWLKIRSRLWASI